MTQVTPIWEMGTMSHAGHRLLWAPPVGELIRKGVIVHAATFRVTGGHSVLPTQPRMEMTFSLRVLVTTLKRVGPV